MTDFDAMTLPGHAERGGGMTFLPGTHASPPWPVPAPQVVVGDDTEQRLDDLDNTDKALAGYIQDLDGREKADAALNLTQANQISDLANSLADVKADVAAIKSGEIDNSTTYPWWLKYVNSRRFQGLLGLVLTDSASLLSGQIDFRTFLVLLLGAVASFQVTEAHVDANRGRS